MYRLECLHLARIHICSAEMKPLLNFDIYNYRLSLRRELWLPLWDLLRGRGREREHGRGGIAVRGHRLLAGPGGRGGGGAGGQVRAILLERINFRISFMWFKSMRARLYITPCPQKVLKKLPAEHQKEASARPSKSFKASTSEENSVEFYHGDQKQILYILYIFSFYKTDKFCRIYMMPRKHFPLLLDGSSASGSSASSSSRCSTRSSTAWRPTTTRCWRGSGGTAGTIRRRKK